MMTLAEADSVLTIPGSPWEIEERSIRGVPTRVWRHAPDSLRTIFEASHQHGELEFLVYDRERMTFARHFDQVARLARALADRYQVKKGDRVAIAMRNYPEWSVAFWAASALGAIVVPLNAWWQAEELRYGLVDSGSRVLIADPERLERVQPLRGELPDLEVVLVSRLPGEPPSGVEGLERVIDSAPASLPDVRLEPEDDATIFYTSGTTGFPKGALGTQRNITSNLYTLEYLRARAELRTGLVAPATVQPCSLLSVPFFHVTGCHSTLVPALRLGSKLVLVYRFDPDETVRLIERERVSSFGGVPTLVWKVLECESFRRHDTSSVVRIGYGGAPAAPELVRRLQETFPQASPSNGYGLTETSSVTSSNAGDTYLAKPGSVGPPVPVCAVKVVDERGEEAPAGGVGELLIRGPNVIKGYWNKPEATAEALAGGWLRSGDVATLDDEGFITIVDRKKDIVIRAGENVYCVEVESALHQHPEVIDAAVFGLPHRVLGEEVAAVVQVRPGAELPPAELRGFLAARLAAFKVPAHLEVTTESFPRNANGKTMKRTLREQVIARLGLLGG